jgi:Arc/MetJ-type ribon-helix-helix transcriptional regulator
MLFTGGRMTEEKKQAIFLTTELYNKIKEQVKVSEFSSVEEYVAFVLEEVLREDDEEEEETFDEEEIKQKLRSLGYLE